MKVGDYIIRRYATHEADIWLITGIYLGGVGQESVVGLIPINRKLASAHSETVEEMLTPLSLVEHMLCEVRHG